MEYKTLTKKNICDVCKKKLFDPKLWIFNSLVKHHISYFPIKIIYVHWGCHHKIHRTNKYPELKPLIEDASKFYNRILDIKKRRFVNVMNV